MDTQVIKINIMGPSRTGKSRYLKQLLGLHEIQDEYLPTINFNLEHIPIKTNIGPIMLRIFDMAANKDFRCDARMLLRDTDGVLLFYSSAYQLKRDMRKIKAHVPVLVCQYSDNVKLPVNLSITEKTRFEPIMKLLSLKFDQNVELIA
jgi:GTPase SAR1 family protein